VGAGVGVGAGAGAGVGAGAGTGVCTGIGAGVGLGTGCTIIGLYPKYIWLRGEPKLLKVTVLAAAAGTVVVPISTAVNAAKNSLCDFMIINSPFKM